MLMRRLIPVTPVSPWVVLRCSKKESSVDLFIVRRKNDRFKDYRSFGNVTTMFVSNLPDWAKKDVVKKIFQKFGVVVDVYMAVKKDSSKKNFAFVRFKKVSNEEQLERSLQGLRYSNFSLIVNIARFERKVLGDAQAKGFQRNHIQRPHPFPRHSGVRDKRSFTEVAAGGGQPSVPPPPPHPG
ncbi:hypothetical protein L1887_20487 [Cichorium endivia]|nr:hypothetical protein L1887_20487 [Cichorium endivia]